MDKNIIEINLSDLDPIEVYIWKHLREKMEIIGGEEVGFGTGHRSGLLWIKPHSSGENRQSAPTAKKEFKK